MHTHYLPKSKIFFFNIKVIHPDFFKLKISSSIINKNVSRMVSLFSLLSFHFIYEDI